VSVLGSLLKDIILQRWNDAKPHNTVESDPVRPLVEAGFFALNTGNLWESHNLYEKAFAIAPDDEAVERLRYEIEFNQSINIVNERFVGPKYQDWLAWFHQLIVPETYLEIGVESGQSLQFAQEPTRAVGVDPEFEIIYTQKNWVKLFKLTSDDFFMKQSVEQVFGVASISMAFIDGLHTFDQALKDFINIELHSTADTVVLLHDIFPVVPLSAQRERITKFWVGDTWKIMWILNKYRQDLKIVTIPTSPSGLGVITNLNKSNTTLQKDFGILIQEAMALDFSTFTDEMNEFLHVVENNFDAMAQLLMEKKVKRT